MRVLFDCSPARVWLWGKEHDGLEATCTKCGRRASVAGTSNRSIMRLSIMLRERCWRRTGKLNLYVFNRESKRWTDPAEKRPTRARYELMVQVLRRQKSETA